MTEEPKTGWARTLLGWGFLLFGVFAFQSVAAKPFYIPSSSMMPSLLNGDRLIVSKYPYGWSQASLTIHGSEIAPGRILGKLPERGDIVTVARRSDGEDLIKRVIGLPGDTIEVRDGLLAINGVEVPRVAMGTAKLRVDANVPCDDPRLERFRAVEDGVAMCRVPMFRETLPNGATYDTLDLGRDASPADNFGPVTVPPGHVFLMGDNRDMSADSRYPLDQLGLGGPVPFETISGRAEFLTYSLDGSGKWLDPRTWLYAVRGARTAKSLRPEKAPAPVVR